MVTINGTCMKCPQEPVPVSYLLTHFIHSAQQSQSQLEQETLQSTQLEDLLNYQSEVVSKQPNTLYSGLRLRAQWLIEKTA